MITTIYFKAPKLLRSRYVKFCWSSESNDLDDITWSFFIKRWKPSLKRIAPSKPQFNGYIYELIKPLVFGTLKQMITISIVNGYPVIRCFPPSKMANFGSSGKSNWIQKIFFWSDKNKGSIFGSICVPNRMLQSLPTFSFVVHSLPWLCFSCLLMIDWTKIHQWPFFPL